MVRRFGGGTRRNRRGGTRRLTRSGGIVRQAVRSVRRRGLATLVRRIANRGVEVKHAGQNVVDAAFNSSIGGSSECYPILPAIGEGTDGNQRIGDRIRPKYLLVKGHLQYDHAFQGNFAPPSTVRVMLLSQRNIKVSSDVSSRVDTSHLLKDNIISFKTSLSISGRCHARHSILSTTSPVP